MWLILAIPTSSLSTQVQTKEQNPTDDIISDLVTNQVCVPQALAIIVFAPALERDVPLNLKNPPAS
jgi:hypothetical protein